MTATAAPVGRDRGTYGGMLAVAVAAEKPLILNSSTLPASTFSIQPALR